MAGSNIDQSTQLPARVPVVAMVASVGGLAAVTTVLADLSEQIEAALLVLIHQEPDRISQLPEILARNGPLPAHHAEGGEALLPGHLLVASHCEAGIEPPIDRHAISETISATTPSRIGPA